MSLDNKKIILACSGKFHYFDFAEELEKKKKLKYLICDYPYFLLKPYNIKKNNFFFLKIGIYGIFLRKLLQFVKTEYIKNFLYNYTLLISKDIKDQIGNNSNDIIIINSTFAYETFKQLKNINFNKILDHGSLHMQFEKKIITELSNKYNLDFLEDDIPNWVIERENEEFYLADKISVLSPLAKKTLIDFGVKKDKINIISPGVNLKNFFPIKKEKKFFTIGQIGGIRLRKGVFDTISAFETLNSSFSKLILVGTPYFSKKVSKFFYTLINKNNNIKFHYSVKHLKLVEFYNDCDVIVHPSLSDGFGLVVLQAMACGKIVICTETTGASYLIKNGVNGFVVPPNAPNNIAEIINFLIENPDKKKEIENNIMREMISLTWSKYTNEYMSFLNKKNG
jgi:glycosyltransferase involved in cell wall biosynthesis